MGGRPPCGVCLERASRIVDKPYLWRAARPWLVEEKGDRNATMCVMQLMRALVHDERLYRQYKTMKATCKARELRREVPNRGGGARKSKKVLKDMRWGSYCGGFDPTTAFRRMSWDFVDMVEVSLKKQRGVSTGYSDDESSDFD